MQTEITIIIGSVITGMITLDKLGILDKVFRRNGKTRATKNDIDHLANNHLHDVKGLLVELKEQNKIITPILNEILYIVRDLKNKK